MEEILLAFIGYAAEILFEVFIQVIGEALVVLVLRSVRNLSTESRTIHPVLATLGYFVFGIACGIVSIFILPHPLVHRSKINGINLVISPAVTGLLMSQVGVFLRRKGKPVSQIESFGYGFTFALGVALVRFIFLN